MSVDNEPQLLSTTTSIFRDALQHARTVKPVASIEPLLSAADFEETSASLAKAQSSVNDENKAIAHLAVETAARNILLESLSASTKDKRAIGQVWNLLDFVQICADKEQCEGGLTLWLIEELLDSQTIDGCRVVFDYLESRCEALIGSDLTQNKRNTILRTCNELLHRLSRAEDTVFCGRVFIFLFKIFPLGDKSAVNLRGEYHTDNKTSFDDSHQKKTTAQDAAADTEMKDAAASTDDTSLQQEQGESKREEDPLYAKFWTMQHTFSNPPRLFEDADLEELKSALKQTLDRFESVPKIMTSGRTQGVKRKRDEADASLSSSFNPKYLTSPDLFKLEVSDVVFQRDVLVQALILMDFALALTPAAKAKAELLKPQKAMIYPYTLSADNEKWAAETRTRIMGYLNRDDEGALYGRMVQTVLARDRNWVKWKMESCPLIAREAMQPESDLEARAGAKRLCTSRRIKRSMGGPDLSFLSQASKGTRMDLLKSSKHPGDAALGSLAREAEEVGLDLEMVDESKEPAEWAMMVSKRASKTWRALRLGTARNLIKVASVDESGSLSKLAEAGAEKAAAVSVEA